MVSQELIKELQTIIKEQYERELSLQEVSKIANDMVGYYDTLAKIYHRIKQPENCSKPLKNS